MSPSNSKPAQIDKGKLNRFTYAEQKDDGKLWPLPYLVNKIQTKTSTETE